MRGAHRSTPERSPRRAAITTLCAAGSSGADEPSRGLPSITAWSLSNGVEPEHNGVEPEHNGVEPEHNGGLIPPEHNGVEPEHNGVEPEHNGVEPEPGVANARGTPERSPRGLASTRSCAAGGSKTVERSRGLP